MPGMAGKSWGNVRGMLGDTKECQGIGVGTLGLCQRGAKVMSGGCQGMLEGC